MRAIQQQTDVHDINFVCIQIDSPGGSVIESTRLANYLADLDPSQIRTVGYVTREARADAALIAFACDHLVVQASAVIGGGNATRSVTFRGYLCAQ
jgi:ClpP class serine protease